MTSDFKTPGVYIHEIPKLPPSIASVETAIPAFVGYTQKAEDKIDGDLIGIPKRISSMVEYEKYFGFAQPEEKIVVRIDEKQDINKMTIEIKTNVQLSEQDRSKHIMYYSLLMFFANGGGSCYIVSAAKYKAMGSVLIEKELEDALKNLEKVDEPTLIVFPEAQFLDIDDFKALNDAALMQCEELKDRFVIMDLHGDDISLSNEYANLLEAVESFRKDGIGSANLKYGAVYAPNIVTTLSFSFSETSTVVTHSINGVVTTVKLNILKDTHINLYEMAKKAIHSFPCKLPPSGAMAGLYALIDNSRGVWKAPANIGIKNIIKPTIHITDAIQAKMNIDASSGKSVNTIREFIGKGTLVWGGRTLAGNDNEWKYINVRRLFIFVEESVKKATEQFVFEPNNAGTWVKVQVMIENFLFTLWRQGALLGIKPEHAFYVNVGLGKTMTAQDILNGNMIIEIAMAAVRPAEFIILRFSHKMAES